MSWKRVGYMTLKLALVNAAENNSTKVLQRIPFVLGNLLNAAISEGDILTASYLFKAGAKVNFGLNYFFSPEDAFHHYAAVAYFQRAKHDFLMPSQDDVMQSYLRLTTSCTKCQHSTDELELFYNHVGQYIEFPLLVAVQQKNIEAINLLLDCGAQKQIDCGNYRGESHTTPFTFCLRSDFHAGVQVFLRRGLNINQVDPSSFEDVSVQILKELLRAGLHHKRISHSSPLAIAAGRDGCIVPVDQQEPAPLSLKFVCRQVIRKALLKSQAENLFIHATSTKLHLPPQLCAYLLCGFDTNQQ